MPCFYPGCANLVKHIETVRKFGVPVVVAINKFASDTPAEMEEIRRCVRAWPGLAGEIMRRHTGSFNRSVSVFHKDESNYLHTMLPRRALPLMY